MTEPAQSILEDKLEWAERCLRAANGHVELQAARLADLEQRGENTDQARALLRILRETRSMHQTECAELRRQIEIETSGPKLSP